MGLRYMILIELSEFGLRDDKGQETLLEYGFKPIITNILLVSCVGCWFFLFWFPSIFEDIAIILMVVVLEKILYGRIKIRNASQILLNKKIVCIIGIACYFKCLF